MHQLQNVIMSLEVAKIFKKDIYALIVGFTSACNTTDHDWMLWIMYDIGFPIDAIDAVKNLYEDATTQIRLPFGIYSENTCSKRHYLRRRPLTFPLPPLYETPSSMAPCRRTWRQTQLHPGPKPYGYPPGQYDQQRLVCRWPYKWNQHNPRP